MAYGNKPLQATSITSPGFFGLNTQDSGVAMDAAFATEASNAVIDRYGRIGARKGWEYKTTSGGTGSNIETVFEFDNNDGTYTLISAGNNKIYTGEATLTQINVRNATNSANLTYTITANDWFITRGQYQSGLNRSPHGYLVQAGHQPLVYHRLNTTGSGAIVNVDSVSSGKVSAVTVTTAGSGYAVGDLCTVTGGTGTGAQFTILTVNGSGGVLTVSIAAQGDGYTNGDDLTLVDTDYHSHENGFGFQRLGDVGSLPSGYTTATFTPNCALAAYGRMWFADIGADNLSIYYSALLEGSNVGGVGSGVINLEKVVPRGDKIIALTAHNNYLIILCQNSIVIYQGVDDISTTSLADVIVGVGCIARDSVQNIGTDVLFLSNSGVRSLERTIQEKSAPVRDISRNVRDSLIDYVTKEDVKKIRSAYYETDAFYLLILPVSNFCFYFDLRQFMQDGSCRAAIWDSINPGTAATTNNRRLLLGKENGIAEYTGYQDNGGSYIFSYYSPYLDFGAPSITKVLKKIGLTVVGAFNTVMDVRWAFDYQTNYRSSGAVTGSVPVSEYGIDEYGIAEYSASIIIDQIKKQLSGSGNVIQIGIDAAINGSPLSVQKIDIYAIPGRTI